MPSNTSRAYWDDLFAAPDFVYGLDPGPIARRAEKYHRALRTRTSTALDIGSGEGQDLAFLAKCGYSATGLDFSEHGVRKTRALLKQQNVQAQVLGADLSTWTPSSTWDLVLSINSLGFVGEQADFALEQTLRAVAPGGVLGLSVWAREEAASPSLQDGVRVWTRKEILGTLATSGTWQKKEVALLWQYFQGQNGTPNEEARPFVTLVAQKLK